MRILLMIISVIHSDGLRLVTSTVIFLFMNYLYIQILLAAGTLSITVCKNRHSIQSMCSPISTLSYQTTRDTTIRTCLEKPPYNNNHLYTILHETQLYLPAYSNHLTITTSCLPYCQRHKYTYLPTVTILQ